MATEELFGAYHFLLEISGITGDSKTIVGGFKTVSGMDSETEIIEFKQGNDRVVRKKPGRTTYANISLVATRPQMISGSGVRISRMA